MRAARAAAVERERPAAAHAAAERHGEAGRGGVRRDVGRHKRSGAAPPTHAVHSSLLSNQQHSSRIPPSRSQVPRMQVRSRVAL